MENKAIKIGFIVFAVLAVVFGFWQIKNTIQITNNPGKEAREEYANALEEAKTRVLDTDDDGLTDWEEINLFNTSVYLADSDSDGVDDKKEIENGTDPNCATGKQCGSDIIGTVEEAQTEIDAIQAQDSAVSSDLNQEFSEDAQAALNALETGGTPTSAQIRALLLDSGVSQEQVDMATDEELLVLFQEAAQQNQAK